MRTALLLFIILLSPSVLAAHAVTKNYVLAQGQFTTTFGAANVGGASFTPGAEAPKRVVLVDQTGTAAPFFACQDADGDGGCGLTAADPAWIGCGAADLARSATPFRADLELTVFVGAVARACPGGVGTRGTVTVAYG